MRKVLGLGTDKDVDLAFLSPTALDRVGRVCRLAPGSFSAVQRIAQSLARIDPRGKRLLLCAADGKPRYRVCPGCAASERTPYFAFHCRFASWRYCPDHDCLLEEGCPSCGAAVELPQSLCRDGKQLLSCVYLDKCARCGERYGATPYLQLKEWVGTVHPAESLLLGNGRALLASLEAQRGRLASGLTLSLAGISRLERLGLLGGRHSLLTAAAHRSRVERASSCKSGANSHDHLKR
jgi:hypothetical protein